MRQSPALTAALAVAILSAAVLTWLALRWMPQLEAFGVHLSAAASFAYAIWPVVWLIPAALLVAVLRRPAAASRGPWPALAAIGTVALASVLGVLMWIPLFKLAAAA